MDDKKPEDGEYVVPYKSMDKGAILQEARILFSQSPLKTRDCYNLTTKILYLLMKGDELNTKEATDVFFAVTKLFQSNDLSLRRMVYLVLKELTAVAQDVIIAISILVKDMNSEQDIQKANAIRVLCRITDTTMLAQIERYVKTALVDKDAYVSSSALVSSMHLTHSSAEVVRRWVDEVQNALNGKTHMVQYHALGVLHKIRQHDRLAVLKTITTLAKGSTIRSPYAHCLLIRYVTQLLQEGTDKERDAALYSYLEQCLRNRSELVSYEAARAFCSLKTVDARDMNSVIAALQMLMNTTKAAMRFAAVKTLHSIADKYPALISNTCSTDLEALIVDSNKSVAALAIVTSMKTEGEVGVDKLLRQLPSLMPDLPDEHKIVIVDSVRELVAKYRHKHQAVINALSGLMRDGGYEFKKTLVETILFIMKEVPESKESALTQLCEFIEDCEFPGMTARIIHLLGTEGPRTLNPSRYIRHIYNRIILESPQVRASAVQALTKFGVLLPELKPRIVALLKRCLIDNDDEVRDRATLCLHLLQQEDAKAVKLILPEVDVPLVNLKRALVQYLEQHTQQKQVAPFDVSTVSREQIVEKKEKKESKAVPDNVAQKQLLSIQQANAAVSVDVVQQKNEELEAKIEAFQRQFKVGALSHTTKSSDLTEAETEFVVSCVKHFFANHVLFQFNVRNTLNDQVIDNVSVEMVPDEDADGFKVEAVLEATRVGCGETRAVWLLLHRPSSAVPVTASFHNTLKFTTKDWDSSSGEVDDSSAMPDQYQIEDVEIALADYIKGTNVEEFAARWEELGEEHECTETFSLSNAKSLQDGVKDILDFLGMTPQEKSDVVPAKRTKHAMFLAGEYIGGIPLLARVRMQIPPSGGVGVQLCIRSTDGELSAAIAGAMFA